MREKLPGITTISHTETPPGWVPEKLRMAKEVWVTEDPVSMICEALTSGARVGLLPVPRMAADLRVLRGIDGLLTDGYLTAFAEWRKHRQIDKPSKILHEADRCAELTLNTWFRSRGWRFPAAGDADFRFFRLFLTKVSKYYGGGIKDQCLSPCHS